MKLILFLLFLLSSIIYSQVSDSLSSDSSSAVIDSLTSLQDTTAAADTTGLLSTEKNIAKVDTLIPLYSSSLSSENQFLNYKEFYWNDYRYIGNIVDDLPFTFLFDRGFIGYPSPVSYYGFSRSDLSILKDGILLNERIAGNFDLNNFQSEYIDSVEAPTLVRGFLYGPYINPASINFITKDFLSIAPYSRIKYYEGAFGEAFIDGIFNLLLFDRFNLFVDVTNRKFDSSYVNTDFSIWQGTVKGKYLLSNNFNIIGEYNIVDNQHGLNYGVDVDSILQTGNDLITTFYDELSAPVSSPFGRENIKQHNFLLRMLGKFYKNFGTDLTFYSRFNQSENDYYLEDIRYQTKRKILSTGVYLNQAASYDFIDVKLLTGFEKNKVEGEQKSSGYYYQSEADRSYFTVSPIVTFNLLERKLKPSIFFRYFSKADEGFSSNRSGSGFDASYSINEMLNLYAGYSSVDLFNDKRFDVIEGGADYNSAVIDASFRIYKTSDFISPEFGLTLSDIMVKEYTGVSLKFAANLWKLRLEGNGAIYSDKKNTADIFSIPGQTLKAGIFYKDILFNDNLNLKTGFTLDYVSGNEQSRSHSDLFQNSESFMQINFSLVGLIQNRARIYFTWENLFNENYFIVPFYPMRERNIRFGLAWELLN